jgi:hypothetical protein
MRIGEKETVAFDWADDLAASEKFTSASANLDSGLSANGNATIGGNNNTQISQQFTVANNTADGYYKITITGTTDGGNVKKRIFYIRVVSDTAPAAANTSIALVRLDEVEAYIGKTTDEDTAILDQLIDGISRQFNSYTDRTLAVATYTNECYDGNGREVMYLHNYPLTGNLAVVEDDIALTAGNENDYVSYNNEGKLVRVNKTWYEGYKMIQVTYTAGYTCLSGNITLPADLRLAALKQIAYDFSRYTRKDLGVDSVTYPDGSISRTQSGLLDEVKQVLDQYRRITL